MTPRGWEAHALSYRGHGGSDGVERLQQWRVRDYVDDVLGVVDSLPQPPVLIGHSIGGSIATKVAALRKVSGLALIATAPLGPLGPELRAKHLRDHPVRMILAALTGDLRIAIPALGDTFFSPAMPLAEKKRHLGRMGGESRLALADALGGKDTPDYAAVRAPSLVVSAVDDLGNPPEGHAQIARLLNGRHVVCAGAHDLMLDVAWEATAQAVVDWLATALNPADGPGQTGVAK